MKKLAVLVTILGMSFSANASADRVLRCAPNNHTESYNIDLEPYLNGKNYVVVEKIQYKTIKTTYLYEVEDVTETAQRTVLMLVNENIYLQADQRRVLTLHKNGRATFEVFWIRGPSLPGYEHGGSSGSYLLSCK